MTLRADKNNRSDTPDKDVYSGGIFDRFPFWTPYIIVLIALLGIVYAGVQIFGQDIDDPASIPVVQAPEKPVKIDPDDPGGMDVPFQDALVYDELSDEGGSKKSVEKLLPEPEKPVERPTAPAPENNAPVNNAPVNNETAQKKAETAAPAPADATGAGQPAETLFPDSEKIITQPPPTPRTTTETENKQAEGEATEPVAGKQEKPEKTADQVIADLAGGTDMVPDNSNNIPSNKRASSPPAGDYVIQFGAVKSRDNAVDEFARLQSAYPELVGPLNRRIQRVDLGDKGIFYRIQGGFVTKAAANDICSQLQQRHSISCLVKQK